MLDYEKRAKDITVLIDNLTSKIIEKLSSDQVSDVAGLINKRLDLLTELVSSVITDHDKKCLLRYLEEFQRDDQLIVEAVNKERIMVKNTLLNIKKIKEYTVNV